MQEIIPMLAYENGIEAIEWLCKAFNFEEIKDVRMMDNGRLTHAELKYENNIIMLATPSPHYESINKHRKYCKKTDKWLQVPWIVNGLLVYVNNIDEHFKKAKENNAEILTEIEDGFPGRRYRCADMEGQRWMFMEKQNRNEAV